MAVSSVLPLPEANLSHGCLFVIMAMLAILPLLLPSPILYARTPQSALCQTVAPTLCACHLDNLYPAEIVWNN